MSALTVPEPPMALPPVDARCERCGGTAWLWSDLAAAPGQPGEWHRCRACPGTGRLDGKGHQRPRPVSAAAA
jgi:hypothetical protein